MKRASNILAWSLSLLIALAVVVLIVNPTPALGQNALGNLNSLYGNWVGQSSSSVAGSSTAATVVLNNCYDKHRALSGGGRQL